MYFSLLTTFFIMHDKYQQEGLVVASIARDDLSTLPGDDPFRRAHWTISWQLLIGISQRFELWVSSANYVMIYNFSQTV